MQIDAELLMRLWRAASFRRLREPEVIEGWFPRDIGLLEFDDEPDFRYPAAVLRHEATGTYWTPPASFLADGEEVVELRQVWPVQVVTTKWETRCPY